MSNVVPFTQKGTTKESQPSILPPVLAAEPASPYAELAVTTNFSFLRGASHPEEFMFQAALMGLSGIGIADRNSVA